MLPYVMWGMTDGNTVERSSPFFTDAQAVPHSLILPSS